MSKNSEKPVKKLRPSRIKYQVNNPVISVRVPQAVKDKYEEMAKKSGKRKNDFFQGLVEDLAKVEKEFLDKWKIESYNEGSRDARLRYAVFFNCDECGKTVYFTDQAVKEALGRFLTETGWWKEHCPNTSEN